MGCGLSLGKDLKVFIGLEVRWVPELVWTTWRKGNY
jgi:hypothetical protein